MAGRVLMRALHVALAASLAACANGTPAPKPTPAPAPTTVPLTRVGRDSTASNLVPEGYGTIRQDDISIVLEGDGFRVSAIPLDESVIRLLAPDSYHTLKSQLDSKRALIMQRAATRGVREPRVWRVAFFGRAPDARFVPTDITVTSGGREYRPIAVIGLTPGFGEQRLQPRDTQTGLLVFEDGLDVSQPVTVTMGTERNTDWDWAPPVAILRRLDTERASVRTRAAGRPH
ncbi:MAG: hypothetical protein ACREBE_13150 [bacterium]